MARSDDGGPSLGENFVWPERDEHARRCPHCGAALRHFVAILTRISLPIYACDSCGRLWRLIGGHV